MVKKKREIQCVVLSRETFKCKKRVKKFIKDNGLCLPKCKNPIRTDKDSYIIRQKFASKFKSLKPRYVKKGVKFIIGFLK